MEPIYFLGEVKWFRTIFIASGIWQGVGFSAIIYIAALTNVNPELYESAYLDGATRIQKMLYISLPSIKPTIMLLLILRMGSLLSSSTEKIYLMYNPITYEVADVLGTYIFRRDIEMSDYSYSAAVGLLNSLANFVLLVLANTLSSKLTEESLW